MQYVDCDRAEKHGNLCLGYSGDTDEPCGLCKNCIKCEGGSYQLGETEKDDQLTKAKELIENIIRVTWGEGWTYSLDWKVKAEQFLWGTEK